MHSETRLGCIYCKQSPQKTEKLAISFLQQPQSTRPYVAYGPNEVYKATERFVLEKRSILLPAKNVSARAKCFQ